MAPEPARDPKIDRPILCFGTGRGGTTVFLQVLSEHPDLAWFSNFTHRFHHRAFYPLAALSRLRDLPWLGNALPYNWKLRPKPREANKLYKAMTDGAFTQPEPLGRADARKQLGAWRGAVRAHLAWHGKPRFVNKHTGFPRCEFFLEIFPDARFIHVMRDGRAVANSLLNVPWWDGTIENSWWWGDMAEEDEKAFVESGKQAVVLAGIVWKTLMRHNERELQLVDSARQFEVNYTNFVANPLAMMERVRAYCELPESAKFNNRIAKIKIHNADDKWKRDLDEEQKRLLHEVIADDLTHFGFEL
jgi:Sulfotransferase family